MKIEIDLNDILGDPEYGVETLQESVKRQVVSALTQKIQSGIQKQIDAELSLKIKEFISKNLEAHTPKIISDLMDAEYVQVDRYGDRHREPTTFRKQLVQAINAEMVYKKANYDSEKNAFTKAIDDVVGKNVQAFKTAFDKMVNETFVAECFSYAQKKMQEKLGIKS